MKVAINGMGRIGRSVLKIALEKNINVVAINDLTSLEHLVYLLKYDSAYGRYNKNVTFGKDFIKIGNKTIKVFSNKDPLKLPWKKLGVDLVVESTGCIKDRKDAKKHLISGAKKVIISAPSANPDVTVVLGVNEKEIKKEHKIISMASCTTNCLAPIVKILEDNFKIKKGFMTTVHAFTNDQRILDAHHNKFTRGRAAGYNIIPTTTGATKSVEKVIPSMKGKLNGLALRVPVQVGSIVDFVAELEKEISTQEINNLFKKYANTKMKGILEYATDPLVSSDIIKNPHSSIINSQSTQVNGDTVKILSWYDNEYGYSSRMVDLIKILK